MEQNKSMFLNLSREDQKSALEAIIFSSDEIVTLKQLYSLLVEEEQPKNSKPKKENRQAVQDENEAGASGELSEAEEITDETQELQIEDEISDEEARKSLFSMLHFVELINEINQELEATNRPYLIINIADGYQFATRREYGELVAQLVKSKTKRRLSQAAMEALAIIAYKQPISKPEIEKIRGVNSNEIVNSLIDKNLIEIVGRKDILGKPLLYGTTDEFLKVFGLNSLDELPKLTEFEEMPEKTLEEIEANQSHIELVIDATQDLPDNKFKLLQETIEKGIVVEETTNIE